MTEIDDKIAALKDEIASLRRQKPRYVRYLDIFAPPGFGKNTPLQDVTYQLNFNDGATLSYKILTNPDRYVILRGLHYFPDYDVDFERGIEHPTTA